MSTNPAVKARLADLEGERLVLMRNAAKARARVATLEHFERLCDQMQARHAPLVARVEELESACRAVHEAWMNTEAQDAEDMCMSMISLEHVLAFGDVSVDSVSEDKDAETGHQGGESMRASGEKPYQRTDSAGPVLVAGERPTNQGSDSKNVDALAGVHAVKGSGDLGGAVPGVEPEVACGPRTNEPVHCKSCKALTMSPDTKGYCVNCTVEEFDRQQRTPEARAPVCSTCNDTHVISRGERTIMCIMCPTPCDRCKADATSPYCAKVPCACTCHPTPQCPGQAALDNREVWTPDGEPNIACRGVQMRTAEGPGGVMGNDPRTTKAGPDDGKSAPRPLGNDELRTCWCYRCLDAPEAGFHNPTARMMILCPACGNKRCPRATDHRLACTDSNEPGQFGSNYGNPCTDYPGPWPEVTEETKSNGPWMCVHCATKIGGTGDFGVWCSRCRANDGMHWWRRCPETPVPSLKEQWLQDAFARGRSAAIEDCAKRVEQFSVVHGTQAAAALRAMVTP